MLQIRRSQFDSGGWIFGFGLVPWGYQFPFSVSPCDHLLAIPVKSGFVAIDP